jgi:positive regulator of sigma E activity
MNSSACIEQQGIIESTDDGVVSVKIQQVSACSTCHSKTVCTLFGTGEKMIDITDNTGRFRRGDRVGVSISQSMGTKAIVLGYFIPFLLVMVTLLVLTISGISEWKTGLLSLAMLIPYYSLLYVFRHKLRNHFIFKLNKIE